MMRWATLPLLTVILLLESRAQGQEEGPRDLPEAEVQPNGNAVECLDFLPSYSNRALEEDLEVEPPVAEPEPRILSESASSSFWRYYKRRAKLVKAQEEERRRNLTNYLDEIHNISNGKGGLCLTRFDDYKIFPYIPIGTDTYKLPKEKADLIAYFMPKMSRAQISQPTSENLIKSLRSMYEEPQVDDMRYLEFFPDRPRAQHRDPVMYWKDNWTDPLLTRRMVQLDELNLYPWLFDPTRAIGDPRAVNPAQFDTLHEENKTRVDNVTGFWTWPYFRCTGNRGLGQAPAGSEPSDRTHVVSPPGKWIISYTVAFIIDQTIYGLLSFDVDLTPLQINQCDYNHSLKSHEEVMKENPLWAFHGTHKCDPITTTCIVLKQNYEIGWLKGNYRCDCMPEHHAYRKEWNNSISGTYLENKRCTNTLRHRSGNETLSEIFKEMVSCRRCPEGCPDCKEKKTCMASTNFVFRLVILCVSVTCAVGTCCMIVVVFKCRKRPVFSASSPLFLCITLVGCIVSYSEMAVLFPVLSTPFCVAVKWTRHLGFCITYTALYMKLCRVYLTFRVKSAHKIKLTEKHLLHWMSPILVIMLLYLFAWTISDPPLLEVMNTVDGMRFHQCVYNWWDHALAIGEIIFLAYGVWICWRIRENPDAQFISYSIYNIAMVNVIMVTLHLLIVPKAGPDMKYLLAFARVQLSTTITIALVLGSKLYRTLRGDLPVNKEIANSANGFGHDALDLDEENLQLKEELQKMATQIERLKSYAMCKNNPHLKSGTGTLSAAKIDYGRLDSFTTL